jgi:AbrB family looped-hinge helix DNA binding protein
MNFKTVLSSKGQMIIPKKIRSILGLHTGSKLILKLEDNNLQVVPIKKDISSFFGMGKKKGIQFETIEDINKSIEQAVIENDKY